MRTFHTDHDKIIYLYHLMEDGNFNDFKSFLEADDNMSLIEGQYNSTKDNYVNRMYEGSFLSRACLNDSSELIEYLIDKGADIHSRSRCSEVTPFLIASKLRYPHHKDFSLYTKNIEFLIANGANINDQDSKGFTALHSAALTSDRKYDAVKAEQVKFLFNLGIDTKIRDNKGRLCTEVENLSGSIGTFSRYLSEVKGENLIKEIASHSKKIRDEKSRVRAASQER